MHVNETHHAHEIILKRSLALWIMFGPSQEDEKTSSEDLQDQDLSLGLFFIRFCF